MRTRTLILGTVVAFGSVPAEAQVEVFRNTGPSVRMSAGMSTISGRSSLELRWIAVRDTALGIFFDEPVGAKGVHDDGWYWYESDMKMFASKRLQAFEVRLLTFNVWGELNDVLTFTQLEDMEVGQRKGFKRKWGGYRQARLREHLTSIAYVARVRLATGETLVADVGPVLDVAREIQGDLTLDDIEPNLEPPPRT